MRHEAFDRAVIGRIEDRRVVLLRLAVRLAADKHRVYDRAQLPAALRPGSFYDGIMRGESGKRCFAMNRQGRPLAGSALDLPFSGRRAAPSEAVVARRWPSCDNLMAHQVASHATRVEHPKYG
jgi:ATP-dependent helicase YprA (DUF1998 family)